MPDVATLIRACRTRARIEDRSPYVRNRRTLGIPVQRVRNNVKIGQTVGRRQLWRRRRRRAGVRVACQRISADSETLERKEVSFLDVESEHRSIIEGVTS